MAKKHDDETGGWVVGRDIRYDTNPETLAEHAAGRTPDPDRQQFRAVKAGGTVDEADLPPQSLDFMRRSGMLVREGVWRRAKHLAKLTKAEPEAVIEACASMMGGGEHSAGSWGEALDLYEERHGAAKVEAGPGAMALNEPEHVEAHPTLATEEQQREAGLFDGFLAGDDRKEASDEAK